MIKRSTLLILGAGASRPFGFPTGRELLERIVQGTVYPDRDDLGRMLVRCGFRPKLVSGFGQELRVSQRNSVDAFLEHRTDFLDVGKAAIVGALSPFENLEPLMTKGDWYNYLFNELNTSFADFDKNLLGVITFNYDRSFEQFMYVALRASYGRGIPESAAKINSIPIVHVNGSLGTLAELEPDGQPYSPLVDADVIQKRSKTITIIHEAADAGPAFQEAHKLLAKAERICFLGFGYDPTNLRRLLAPSDVLVGKRVVGSAYGFTGAERSRIQSSVQGPLQLCGESQDCLGTLRETGILF